MVKTMPQVYTKDEIDKLLADLRAGTIKLIEAKFQMSISFESKEYEDLHKLFIALNDDWREHLLKDKKKDDPHTTVSPYAR